ncbi:MAG: DUF2513 domain-containing protein [Nitrosomonas sp.]|nr:DUF2513 domain-containing protein [Nitrosomonas sp.]
MSLVRKILLWAIDQPNGYMPKNPSFEEYTDEQIGYHIWLMEQAKLINAIEQGAISSKSPQSIIVSVTWDGHDFADAAKNDVLWKKALNIVLNEGQSFTFDLLKSWLKSHAQLMQ